MNIRNGNLPTIKEYSRSVNSAVANASDEYDSVSFEMYLRFHLYNSAVLPMLQLTNIVLYKILENTTGYVPNKRKALPFSYKSETLAIFRAHTEKVTRLAFWQYCGLTPQVLPEIFELSGLLKIGLFDCLFGAIPVKLTERQVTSIKMLLGVGLLDKDKEEESLVEACFDFPRREALLPGVIEAFRSLNEMRMIGAIADRAKGTILWSANVPELNTQAESDLRLINDETEQKRFILESWFLERLPRLEARFCEDVLPFFDKQMLLDPVPVNRAEEIKKQNTWTFNLD